MKQISSKKFIKQTIKEYRIKGLDREAFKIIFHRHLRACKDRDMAEVESIAELIKYLKHRKNAKFN
jgi:hypothetical protein